MDIIIPTLIYLVIPEIGFAFFVLLVIKTESLEKTKLFTAKLFFNFAHYGGLLLLVLTGLFWKISGLATLGVLYLMFIAVFIMLFIAIHSFLHRNKKLEYYLFLSSSLYLIIFILFMGFSLLSSR